jgi:primosomal protein N'
MHKAVGDNAVVAEACPAPLAKIKNYFRYQVIMRSGAVRTITTHLKQIVRTANFPHSISIAIDVDALDIM